MQVNLDVRYHWLLDPVLLFMNHVIVIKSLKLKTLLERFWCSKIEFYIIRTYSVCCLSGASGSARAGFEIKSMFIGCVALGS